MSFTGEVHLDQNFTSEKDSARIEGGRRMPSVKTLLRYAAATDSRPQVKMVAVK